MGIRTDNSSDCHARRAAGFYQWELLILLWFAFFLHQGDRQIFNNLLASKQCHTG